MSPKNLDDRDREPKINSQLKSSIVHKPFATGTVNIFNPHRQRGKKTDSQLTAPKLYLNAELEPETSSLTDFESEPTEIEYHESRWVDTWLNGWSITAVSLIFLANLVSGAIIRRNYRTAATTEPADTTTLGSASIATEEFMPLNLSTLSRLNTAKDVEESTVIEPIAPALAPIELASNVNSEYYYILSEYSGDASLARVRKRVERISLVNLPQGVFIYMGAYKNRDEADIFVAHLKESNLAAQVYPPS